MSKTRLKNFKLMLEEAIANKDHPDYIADIRLNIKLIEDKLQRQKDIKIFTGGFNAHNDKQ